MTAYLSASRLNPAAAIKEIEEFMPIFYENVDIQISYLYLLWSQGISEKEKAVNSFQRFFSAQDHRKTDKKYLSFFALGTGYCINFDLRYRKYSNLNIRNSQYMKTFNEYGRILFQYVRKRTIQGKASLFHNIRVALIQTAKMCEILGRYENYKDKIQYGLDICEWMQQSNLKEPFLTQIAKLQERLQEQLPGKYANKEMEDSPLPIPPIEIEDKEGDSAQDSFSVKGKQYTIGDIVEVTISHIVPYGVFVSLDSSTDGLIHISEIANRFISDINSEFSVGQKCKARIINIEPKTARIALSTRDFRD